MLSIPEGLLGLERHKYSWTVFLPVCLSVLQPFIRLLTTVHQNTFRGIEQNPSKRLCLKGASLLTCHTSLGKRFLFRASCKIVHWLRVMPAIEGKFLYVHR